MRGWRQILVIVGGLMICNGCVSINVPSEISASLLPPDTSFIINGTAQAAVDATTFPIWLGEDGQAFVLFQTLDIKNDTFDAVMTPGALSRLQLQVRNDLAPLCQPGVVPVEVIRILRINDKNMQ